LLRLLLLRMLLPGGPLAQGRGRQKAAPGAA
jgi:hypothetical protein